MPISFDWSKTISELPGNPIPSAWIQTQGQGIKVAFIDTGVNLGMPSLEHLKKPGRRFFTGAEGFSVAKLTGQDLVGEAFGLDGVGHGTLYASLLAGKTPEPAPIDKDLIVGLANGAEYYIIKARNANDRKTTVRNLLNALELCGNLGIEIAITGQCISCSEMAFEGLSEADVNRVFDLPAVKSMHIFAPLKNLEATDTWEGITSDNFPSHRPGVFNVAKLPDNFEENAELISSLPIAFLLSGFCGEVLTKTGNADELHFSNSGAVALMGGIAVLAASFHKQQNGGALPDRNQLQQLLGSCTQSLDHASSAFAKPALFKNF